MLKNIIAFLCGAGLGAGVTYVVLKEKFNNDVQAEINQYKADKRAQEEEKAEKEEVISEEVLEIPVNTSEESKEAAQKSINKPSIEDVAKNKSIVENYTTYSKVDSTPVKEGADMKKIDEAPYAIIDTRYNEETQYYKETLNYYEVDGVLTDMSDNPLNLHEYIGEEALEHIGDQYPDVVYVRNEKKNTDYEVCVVHSDFESIVGKDDDDEED